MKLNKTTMAWLCALPGITFAGGFQINTQSIKGVGMAGAYSGVCKDASATFFNPGAMGFLEKSSFTLGGSVLLPKASYLNPYGGNVDMKSQTFFCSASLWQLQIKRQDILRLKRKCSLWFRYKMGR
jgi:long-subunit fatty acid transport protein